jgi:hypothetical protein
VGGGGGGGGWLSGLFAAATPRAADEDADAAEDDGGWDVALRGLRLPVGTRVFVDEGTKEGRSRRGSKNEPCPLKPFPSLTHFWLTRRCGAVGR